MLKVEDLVGSESRQLAIMIWSSWATTGTGTCGLVAGPVDTRRHAHPADAHCAGDVRSVRRGSHGGNRAAAYGFSCGHHDLWQICFSRIKTVT
jgi:hypothetical protein